MSILAELEELVESVLLETHGEFSKLEGRLAGTLWVPSNPGFDAISLWCQLHEENSVARLDVYYYIISFIDHKSALLIQQQLESSLRSDELQLILQRSPIEEYQLLMQITLNADSMNREAIYRAFTLGHHAQHLRTLAKTAGSLYSAPN